MWLVDQVRMGEKLKREEYHDVLHRELVNFHRIFGYNTNLSARVCSEFVNKVQNNGAVRNESAWDPGGLSKCWNVNWRTWLNCSKYLASTELVELGERAKVSVIYHNGQDKGRHGGIELYVEVKSVDVLGFKRTIASQRTISSCGDEITVSVFDFFSLEDKTDLLTGRKLMLY
ncbi:hypothetical protein Bca4012_045647 [Brassica carinata]|uniref:Uncharacterized protein n=1 Tax=Brassica carinata TaxID=52824 RepID=A0A8X7UD65_BRACI|nr:hypothetical protein Bca52824_056907 [Brassica carinata]